jgi:hypothetical protein
VQLRDGSLLTRGQVVFGFAAEIDPHCEAECRKSQRSDGKCGEDLADDAHLFPRGR